MICHRGTKLIAGTEHELIAGRELITERGLITSHELITERGLITSHELVTEREHNLKLMT